MDDETPTIELQDRYQLEASVKRDSVVREFSTPMRDNVRRIPDVEEMVQEIIRLRKRNIRLEQLRERAMAFYDEYAKPSMLPPTCFICGLQLPIAISHVALPSIVICYQCVSFRGSEQLVDKLGERLYEFDSKRTVGGRQLPDARRMESDQWYRAVAQLILTIR